MGALDGLKVIEAGLLVQGPQAAATLREWGAEVVKVELPGVGDQSRWVIYAMDDMRSAFFTACNRGKRSVTLDLRKPGGREAFLRLADTADVIISNFMPGTLEGWGLGYDDVSARNPRIVYAVGSCFGTKGTDGHRAGADLAAQAAGGLMSTVGRTDDDTSPLGITIADHIAAQNVVGGVLAALYARERTGRGQRIETSLMGGQIWAQAPEYTAHIHGRDSGRAGGGHPLICGLYGSFRTADGHFAIVGLAGGERRRFYEILGRPELEDRFPTPLYFADQRAELFPLIDEAMSEKTTAEWCATFEAQGWRYAPVRTHAEVLADPNAWANGFFAEVDGPAGPEKVVTVPVEFSATPASPPAFAPELGQHTEEVLLEAGYEWDEIAALRDAGAI